MLSDVSDDIIGFIFRVINAADGDSKFPLKVVRHLPDYIPQNGHLRN
jgi:hypothetical protein